MLVSGDFRQTLPVVRHGSRTEVIESSVKSSYLWSYFMRMTLNENLRISDNDSKLKQWLLDIGNGKNFNSVDLIEIPEDNITEKNDIAKEII